jgi:hypothetical protein
MLIQILVFLKPPKVKIYLILDPYEVFKNNSFVQKFFDLSVYKIF